MFAGSFQLSCGDAAGISRGATPNAPYLKKKSNPDGPITPGLPEWLHANTAINCRREAPTHLEEDLPTFASGPQRGPTGDIKYVKDVPVWFECVRPVVFNQIKFQSKYIYIYETKQIKKSCREKISSHETETCWSPLNWTECCKH